MAWWHSSIIRRSAGGSFIASDRIARTHSVCTLASCTRSMGRGENPALMMPCRMSEANNFLVVWVMISFRWARTSTGR